VLKQTLKVITWFEKVRQETRGDMNQKERDTHEAKEESRRKQHRSSDLPYRR